MGGWAASKIQSPSPIIPLSRTPSLERPRKEQCKGKKRKQGEEESIRSRIEDVLATVHRRTSDGRDRGPPSHLRGDYRTRRQRVGQERQLSRGIFLSKALSFLSHLFWILMMNETRSANNAPWPFLDSILLVVL